MHPSVKRYLEALEIYEKASKDMNFAEEELSNADLELSACKLPDNLREAQPSDIVEGTVIWYKAWAGTGNAKIVEYLFEPSIRGLSFSAHDGDVHVLEGAYVEVEEEIGPGFDAEILAKALEECLQTPRFATQDDRTGQVVWDNAQEALDQFYKAQEIS